MDCSSVCTIYEKLQIHPLLVAHQPKTRTTQPFQLGISVKKRSSISYIKTPHRHYYSSFQCRSQLSSEIAPVASAAYGALLLGGGLFACNLYIYSLFYTSLSKWVAFFICLLYYLHLCEQIQELRVKGHFLVDLLGLLSWAL